MALKDSDILNLPDAPDFISKPPEMTLIELIALCEKMLPYWNKERYSKPEPEFVGEAFKLLD
jgi:hypothetical protein